MLLCWDWYRDILQASNARIDAHYLKFTNISDKLSKDTGSKVRSSVYQSVLLWYCSETDVGVFVQVYTLQTRSCRNWDMYTRQNSPPFWLKLSKGTEPKVRSTVYQCGDNNIVLGLVQKVLRKYILCKREHAGIEVNSPKFTNTSVRVIQRPRTQSGEQAVTTCCTLWFCANTGVWVFGKRYYLQATSCKSSDTIYNLHQRFGRSYAKSQEPRRGAGGV